MRQAAHTVPYTCGQSLSVGISMHAHLLTCVIELQLMQYTRSAH